MWKFDPVGLFGMSFWVKMTQWAVLTRLEWEKIPQDRFTMDLQCEKPLQRWYARVYYAHGYSRC